MHYLLNNFSGITACIILMTVAAVVAILVLKLLRKQSWLQQLKKDHEVSVAIFGTISLLYSLIVAFVMVAVWEDYEEMNSNILQQADKLEKVKLQAMSLPVALQERVERGVQEYVAATLKEAGNASNYSQSASIMALYKLRGVVAAADTAKPVWHGTLSAIDNDVVDVIELHNYRHGNVHSHIPSVVWFALIFGSIVVVVFSGMFRAENTRLEYVYVALIAAFIAMCLTAIYILDHPASGMAGVSLKPLKQIID